MVKIEHATLLLISMYMRTDTECDQCNLDLFNDVLQCVANCMNTNDVNNVIIAGDLNTDLNRN